MKVRDSNVIRFSNYRTDIEQVIESLLISNNINYVFQYPIRCKFGYIADFYLPECNLIIEADGEAWHNFKRDNAKTFVLKGMGYNIIRFKGQKILNNPEQVLLDITQEMKGGIEK